MTEDPFDLAAEIATLAATASVNAVRREFEGKRCESDHLMRRAKDGIEAIKSGSAERMQRQVELLRQALAVPA